MLPLLPVLYFKARKTRKLVPVFKEPEDVNGQVQFETEHDALNVLCVGESTMAGIGVLSHEDGLAGSIAKELSIQYERSISWNVVAKSGLTVRQLRNLIIDLGQGKDPDIVIVAVGGNDAFGFNSPWKWKADLKNLIDTLQENYVRAPIFFLNMPPVSDFPALPKILQMILGAEARILGEALSQCLGQYKNVYYNKQLIKLDEWVARFDGKYKQEDFFSDGIHPSPLTYRIWGREMVCFIKDTLSNEDAVNIIGQ